MSRFAIRLCGAALLWGGLVLVAATPARPEDRSTDVILAEIDAIEVPTLDPARQKSRVYVQQTTKKRKDAAAKKAKLIGELQRVEPDNPRLAELLPERWRARFAALTGVSAAKEMTSELNEVLANTQSDDLKKEAVYWKARIATNVVRGDAAKVKAVDEFLALDPKDPRGAELLATLVSRFIVSPDTKKALSQRLAQQYPDSSKAGSTAGQGQGDQPQSGAVGKPFNLEFYDAVSGAPVSTQRLKGKVVVVDFWATWCGPCVAEMPKMKSLYAEYRPRGAQFIGVSLDQGGDGLDKLQAFVQENGITWPQYYQGNGWESEFSRSWGIRAIPTVFVVDQEGKVYSDKARGKLESILPELLGRSAKGAGAGAAVRGR
jgi:thiol-disulfide isomerase/thioredoxin